MATVPLPTKSTLVKGWALALGLAATLSMSRAEEAAATPGSPGPFLPTWESLQNYECPEWFRDAKFGIWSHWGPQAVPMEGDHYAKNMYAPGGRRGNYEYHVKTYGHPSVFGFKDIIPLWKAERFDPDRLMALYKAAGARYFVSMGVHHDNFDLWNSRHHRWNSVQMGPKRDIVGEWQTAARKQGLKFGVSEHLAASFTWFQTAHGSDREGPMAGVPYDGADPRWQDLYHPKANRDDRDWYTKDERWPPIWLARITDLIDQYNPDLLYSDGALPFGEVGRRMLAHFYNSDWKRNGGKLQAVYCLKDWNTKGGHGEYVEGIGVQDVERGGLAAIKRAPWQTDTSIGDWYYNRNWKTKDTGGMYRSAGWVVRNLVDIVSKNGNMLLNVVQRPDGSLDAEVEELLAEVGTWLEINGEAIYETRPWHIFGEGAAKVGRGHHNEDFELSATDIRFTQSKDGRYLYAIALGWPDDGRVTIRSLAGEAGADRNRIRRITLLGHTGPVEFVQTARSLEAQLPAKPVSRIACVLRIDGANLLPFQQ